MNDNYTSRGSILLVKGMINGQTTKTINQGQARLLGLEVVTIVPLFYSKDCDFLRANKGNSTPDAKEFES